MNPLPKTLRGDGPCQDCGTSDNIVWFTESVFWNAVMRATNPPGQGNGGVVCIPCFVIRTQSAGYWPTGWRLVPDFHWETVEQAEARRRPLAALLAAPASQSATCSPTETVSDLHGNRERAAGIEPA